MTIDGVEPRPAGFWIRALARFIDWLAVSSLTFCMAFVMVAVSYVLQRLVHWRTEGLLAALSERSWITWIEAPVSLLCYHSISEGLAGATLGKMFLGLQVVDVSLAPCGVFQALRRSLGFYVDALFLGAIGASEISESPIKQRVGDRWANTRVVYRGTLPDASRASRGHMLIAIAGGLTVAARSIFVFTVLHYLWMSRS